MVFGLTKNATLTFSSKSIYQYLLKMAEMSYSLQKLFQWHRSSKHVSILREVRRGVSRAAILGFQRADFGPFRSLVDRVPWKAVLKGKGVQEGWAFFKKEILKVQEQAIPMCRKMSQQGRRPAWLNRELWLELWKKKRVYDLW